MHLIRRSILQRLLLRMKVVKFGFTFIGRGHDGRIENAVLEPFDSFAECCAAADKVANARPAQPVERVEIIPCEYDEDTCNPQVMSVLRTLRRSAQLPENRE